MTRRIPGLVWCEECQTIHDSTSDLEALPCYRPRVSSPGWKAIYTHGRIDEQAVL